MGTAGICMVQELDRSTNIYSNSCSVAVKNHAKMWMKLEHICKQCYYYFSFYFFKLIIILLILFLPGMVGTTEDKTPTNGAVTNTHASIDPYLLLPFPLSTYPISPLSSFISLPSSLLFLPRSALSNLTPNPPSKCCFH